MTIHRHRFNGRVEDYARYRLRFPAMILQLLREHCGLLPGDVIADVGAGTGMSAELFLTAGHRVIAIEPNAEMRAACEQLKDAYSGLTVRDGTAEASGLDDASIDMVAVGRAFHWFDQAKALAEFARILRPGGWVILLTSRRAMDASERALEYEHILLTYGDNYGAVRKAYTSFSDLKPFGETEHLGIEVPGLQRLSIAEFLGQTQSLSIAPMPGQPHYEAMQTALNVFFAKWSHDGVLELETTCEVLGWRTSAAVSTR